MKKKSPQQIGITSAEKKKYVLSTNADFEILSRCKELEKLKLTKQDLFLVRFIKTQLEDDWRKPLLRVLNQVLRKYKK